MAKTMDMIDIAILTDIAATVGTVSPNIRKEDVGKLAISWPIASYCSLREVVSEIQSTS